MSAAAAAASAATTAAAAADTTAAAAADTTSAAAATAAAVPTRPGNSIESRGFAADVDMASALNACMSEVVEENTETSEGELVKISSLPVPVQQVLINKNKNEFMKPSCTGKGNMKCKIGEQEVASRTETVAGNSCSSSSAADTKESRIQRKRKRSSESEETDEQRMSANERERTRTRAMNEAFSILKDMIPVSSNEKLSKIQILMRTYKYIGFLHTIIASKNIVVDDNTSSIKRKKKDALDAANRLIKSNKEGDTKSMNKVLNYPFNIWNLVDDET